MTSASVRLAPPPSIALARWLAPTWLVLGLAAIVGTRWWATSVGADALWVGVAFGLGLAGLSALGGTKFAARSAPLERRLGRAQLVRQSKALAVGVAFGLALVAVAVAGSGLAGGAFVPGVGRPAAPFVPWAAITILVASAEEALLRGRLFDAVRRAGGVVPALAITTVAFALIHVPLYGWHVVPLDLAVGLGLGGLRLATGGVTAPAAAHAIADLATWWL
jgi:CAAX amino terminal protease family.